MSIFLFTAQDVEAEYEYVSIFEDIILLYSCGNNIQMIWNISLSQA